MLLTAHGLQLGRGHDHCVRRQPDDEAHDEHEHHVLDVLLEALGPGHPIHALPEVIISGQEERADHHRLDDEEPGQEATHQRDPHLLPVRVHFTHEPVTGEGERNQEADPDKHRHIAHPVIVGPLLIGLRSQEPIGRVRRDHAAAERHISEKAVHVNGIPECCMDDVPDVAQIPSVSIHAGWRLHEGDPRIGQHHQNRSDHVQDHRHGDVDPLQEPLFHPVPGIVVDIERAALRYKE